jgi:hypothetical protein
LLKVLGVGLYRNADKRGNAVKLTIELKLDNDAFTPDWTIEASAILKRLADRKLPMFMEFAGVGTPLTLMDTNGNAVGTVLLEESESD